MYKTHPKIWSYFLVPRFIKNTVNSYSCIRRTPTFDVQFWGKKVRLIHETVRYFRANYANQLDFVLESGKVLTDFVRREINF